MLPINSNIKNKFEEWYLCMNYYKRISSISTAKKNQSFQNFARYKEKGLKEHSERKGWH